MDVRLEAWKEHFYNWRHCLRCTYADWRMTEEPERRKRATPVPMAGSMATHSNWKVPEVVNEHPVAILLPFPDPVQSYWASPVGNPKEDRRYWSPQINALAASWASMDGMLPYELAEVPIVFAHGCYPVNFARKRTTVDASATLLKSCRLRWQEELILIDPVLVISLDHWSHSALWPNQTKKGNYVKNLGEVLPFQIEGPRGDLEYTAYVGPSALEAAHKGREDQWLASFKPTPPISAATDPVHALRWALFQGCWLAKTLELSRDSMEPVLPSPQEGLEHWNAMVHGINKYYESRNSVKAAVELVESRLDYMTLTEMSDQDVRKAQDGEIPTERPKTYAMMRAGNHTKREFMPLLEELEDVSDADSDADPDA